MTTATIKPENNGKLSNYNRTVFPISQITIKFEDSIRPEESYTQQSLESLAMSIHYNGDELINPITIKSIGVNQYEVVAGRRRFLACRDILKLETIQAKLIDVAEDSIFEIQFAENEERVNWTDYDYAKAIEILKSKNKSLHEISATLHKTLDWVKKKSQHINTIKELEDSGATYDLIKNLTTSEIGLMSPLNKEQKLLLAREINSFKGDPDPLTVSEIKNRIDAILKSNKTQKKKSEPPKEKTPESAKKKTSKPALKKETYLIPETDLEKIANTKKLISSLTLSLESKKSQITKLTQQVSELNKDIQTKTKDLKTLVAKLRRSK
ncbi:MAG: ParB N-terminal domain-containing protein [Leptospiraceae bacterium]|nr:ParB N-terminal domain-containing protein [Leptospiraceae bacterium]